MLALQAVTPATLAGAVRGLSIEEARRVIGAIHRNDRLPLSVRNVRRSSMDAVRASGSIPKLTLRSTQHSRLDPFVKFALETSDGEVIETVRIPLERRGRYTVCVSSQIGCGLGCAFCATARIGLRRNLETWEIVEQVRVVRRSLDLEHRERVHGIVFQGMGEPLANLDHVIEAIRVACEPSGLAVDGRTVTVCTAGIPRGIRRLAREVPKVRLAVSITSTHPVVRRNLMPISHTHPLREVLEASVEHARTTRLAPMWAVTPLEHVNDTPEDARELARLAREFAEKAGVRPRISIVPYNAIDDDGHPGFRRSVPEREFAFRKALSEAGFPSHKRYSGGSDVAAACGQLAGSRSLSAQPAE